ncbi:MAG: phage holin family protein [Gemmatimonadales bacterium]|nr:phage holin family protein [Gemmatimonadales bacterium]
MRSVVLHWLLNAAALWAAAWLLPGLEFRGSIVQLLLVAAVFGVVNSLVRPILTVLTCPLIVVTLGLFTLVINALMLMLTGALSERWGLGFAVSGFWPAFFGGLVVGLVSVMLSLFLPGKRGEA